MRLDYDLWLSPVYLSTVLGLGMGVITITQRERQLDCLKSCTNFPE